MMAREESYYDQTRQSDTLDAWDELRRRNELPTEGPVHQFDRRGVRTVNEDLYGGGPQAFDPRVALELIRNPEGMAQHLASLNREPPTKDFEEGEVMPRDAHMSLGKHLASAEFAGGKAPNWFPELDTELGRSEPEPAGLPQAETQGRYDEPTGLPGQYDPISGHPIGQPLPPPRMGQGGMPYVPPPSAAPRPIGPLGPWSRPREGNEAYDEPFPSPNPRRQSTSVGQALTVPPPPPEAPNTGAAPAPSTSPVPLESGISREPAPNAGTEQFGEESSETPKGLVTSREPGKPVSGGPPKAAEKEGPLDSFARALMGLKAPQYQNPVHVTSPQAPRPTNLLARSTVPQTLMQEISALGHPAASFRLGEALRGK